jgi:hypothetical protein
MFAVTVMTPTAAKVMDGVVDSASTDVVFPLQVAQACGLDLRNAPPGQATQAGGRVLSFRYAHVRLRITDGREAYEWDAPVGVLNVPGKRYALLGHAGFLDFFDVTLRGAAKEVLVTPNASFSGRWQRLVP